MISSNNAGSFFDLAFRGELALVTLLFLPANESVDCCRCADAVRGVVVLRFGGMLSMRCYMLLFRKGL